MKKSIFALILILSISSCTKDHSRTYDITKDSRIVLSQFTNVEKFVVNIDGTEINYTCIVSLQGTFMVQAVLPVHYNEYQGETGYCTISKMNKAANESVGGFTNRTTALTDKGKVSVLNITTDNQLPYGRYVITGRIVAKR